MIDVSSPRPSRRTTTTIWFAVALAFIGIAAFAPREWIATRTSEIEHVSVVKSIHVAYRQPSIGTVSGLAIKSPPISAERSLIRVRANDGRRLARSADLALIVDDVDAALARLETLARRSGGATTSLVDNAPSTPGERHTAQLTLSVPDATFESSLGRFTTIGAVASRTIATDDLTDRLVDASARLRNLRREERDLATIMDRSGKVAEILDVEQYLTTVREAIETLDAERVSKERRVIDATISISLANVATATTQAPTATAQLADAWRAALANVESFSIGIAARTFVAIVFVPYLLLAAFAALAARRVFERRFRRT